MEKEGDYLVGRSGQNGQNGLITAIDTGGTPAISLVARVTSS